MYNYPQDSPRRTLTYGQPYGNYPPGVAPGTAAVPGVPGAVPGIPPGAPGAPRSMVPGMGLPPGIAPGVGPGAPPGMAPGIGSSGAAGVSPGIPGVPPGVPGIGPPGAPVVSKAAPPIGGIPGVPTNFQPPANINFSASVIRLGSAASSKPPATDPASTRPHPHPESTNGGVGRPSKPNTYHDQRDTQRNRDHLPPHPPTREEIARTIFVGNLTAGVTNAALESILRSAGGLRRWTRATDSRGKECDFGFAEFEDAQSLETAAEILPDVQIPAAKVDPANASEVKKSRLLIVIDEESKKYAAEWKSKRDEGEEVTAARRQAAQTALEKALSDIFNPSSSDSNDDEMKDVEAAAGDAVTIPLAGGDDLADIPPEVRETVIAEIAAFRERSNRRDMETLRRDEEMERNARRAGLNSPAAHGKAANGVPLGPRDRSGKVHTASDVPLSRQSERLPGVTIADRAAIAALEAWLGPEDDTDASDNELEQQRRAKKEAEVEKLFLDQERRWLNRERSRTAALEREAGREKEETRTADRKRESMAKFLREFDDDDEKTHGAVEDYYQDRAVWTRKRVAFRGREKLSDEQDRVAEQAEIKEAERLAEEAKNLADDFLSEQAVEIESKRKAAGELSATTAQATKPAPEQQQQQQQQQKIKLSFGAAAASKVHSAPRRLGAEVEGLLEDGEDTEVKVKRTLRPIQFDGDDDDDDEAPTRAGGAEALSRVPPGASSMTAEERKEAAQQLATDIPTTKEELWSWPIAWDHITDETIKDQLIPFVEKKIVEFLGVQEQMLVEVVEEHIRTRKSAEELVKVLEEVLDEDAEVLVKKLWRMVIFFAESGRRGLSGL